MEMSEMWEPLRQSGAKILDNHPRFEEVRQWLRKQGAPISLDKERKLEIRDDIYNSRQDDRKPPLAYAKEHLDGLSYLANDELEWLLDWQETFINSALSDVYPITSNNPDAYPPLKDFEGMNNLDWILYHFIKGKEPEDLYPEVSLSAVIVQLPKARANKAQKEKLTIIKDFLRTHPEVEGDFVNGQLPQCFQELDTDKVSPHEIRRYWVNHYLIPKQKSKAATIAIEAYTEEKGEPPTWGEDLSTYIPKEFRYLIGIQALINSRLKDRTLRIFARDTNLLIPK